MHNKAMTRKSQVLSALYMIFRRRSKNTIFHVTKDKHSVGSLIRIRGQSHHTVMHHRGLKLCDPNKVPARPELGRDPNTDYPFADPQKQLLVVFKHNWDENRFRAQQLVEHLFEDVRQREFRRKPSRFQSLFAFESVQDAKRFKHNYNRLHHYIYEVEIIERAKTHKGDMHWLDCAALSFDEIEERARAYWRGQSSEAPFWEWLIEGSVKVTRIVAIPNSPLLSPRWH